MKKLIVVFVATLSLCITSCGSDDDGVRDPLIGAWQFTEAFENGESITSDPCDLQDILTFNADFAYVGRFFEDDGSGTCIELELVTGTWENGGNNVYSFTSEGETDTETITFSENTFTIEYSETFEGTTTVYREVYTRI
ncbi:hypothetical protein GCM10009430_08910 [Aquimarina litoralis]|uniref:Lipocalin-like domain-containing protein n=1 Tax=Aquimarina litoralis TaxID=584605 RepID=A0ABP3TPX2_9FLAO